MRGRDGGAEMTGRLPLVLSALAFGLYVTGYNVARRDVCLDGALLYEARRGCGQFLGRSRP